MNFICEKCGRPAWGVYRTENGSKTWCQRHAPEMKFVTAFFPVNKKINAFRVELNKLLMELERKIDNLIQEGKENLETSIDKILKPLKQKHRLSSYILKLEDYEFYSCTQLDRRAQRRALSVGLQAQDDQAAQRNIGIDGLGVIGQAVGGAIGGINI